MSSNIDPNSPLYSADLAPVEPQGRTWGTRHIAALWVGMAVCIPTYLLAAQMLYAGLSWLEAVCIIALGNLIITVPMVLNGQAGVRYGLPFPVIGRAAFGTRGIHVAALLRGLVACGWFGIQTWIGGLSLYAIGCALTGTVPAVELSAGKFVGFGLFWLLNLFFIVRGTESIKWLEEWSAPILLGMGLFLIGWSWYGAGSFGKVLEQSAQLQTPTVQWQGRALELRPLLDAQGQPKATEYSLRLPAGDTAWLPLEAQPLPAPGKGIDLVALAPAADTAALFAGKRPLYLQFHNTEHHSTEQAYYYPAAAAGGGGSRWWMYLLQLTAMVGFWATMSISISDITRFARDARSSVRGQFLGLPGTMALYSFVGIFVTCAALINFDDILTAEDAPWDPVSLLSRFQSPVVMVVAQLFLLIATLSTNIAANVIAPSYAFANLFPRRLSLAGGGLLTGIVGILICPWWLMNSIAGLLIFVSGLLGPVLGVLLADYFVVRRQRLDVGQLFDPQGIYAGFNPRAFAAMGLGMALALTGAFVPALAFLYNMSWFIGFGVSFGLYAVLMPKG